MRQIAIVLSVAILVACSKKDDAPVADSTPANTNPPASPMNLANVAGTWDVQVVGESSDSVLLTYQLTATADTSGWTFTFPNREPVPMRVVLVDADSAVLEAGPYESALRPGVQVSTVSSIRLRGDRLMGRTTARYQVTTADSVVLLRTRGRRAQ